MNLMGCGQAVGITNTGLSGDFGAQEPSTVHPIANFWSRFWIWDLISSNSLCGGVGGGFGVWVLDFRFWISAKQNWMFPHNLPAHADPGRWIYHTTGTYLNIHQLIRRDVRWLSGPVWVDNWEDRDDITATWWRSSCGLNLSKRFY